MKTYYVFVRDWWKENPSWPNGLEPDSGAEKTILRGGRGLTEEEAREMAQEWNKTHDPGRYSRKAEFDEE